jgi:hypothetical protein
MAAPRSAWTLGAASPVARRADRSLSGFRFMTHAPGATWRPVRKDLVDPSTFCASRGPSGRRHRIRLGHAWILCDADGHEHAFDVACAEAAMAREPLCAVAGCATADAADAALSVALSMVPDLTVRDQGLTLASGDDLEAHLQTRRRPGNAAQAEQALRRAAIRYLVLRMDKVAAVPRIQPAVRFAPLEPLYEEYLRTGTLSLMQAQRVVAIERSPATPAKLKTTNLLDIYTAHARLERRIAESSRVDEIRFLRGVVDWLARHLVLTQTQIKAAGLELHPHAFHCALGSGSLDF